MYIPVRQVQISDHGDTVVEIGPNTYDIFLDSMNPASTLETIKCGLIK